MKYPIHPWQNAFPVSKDTETPGLTKREYLAGLAMQGLLAAQFDVHDLDVDSISFKAVKLANALIAQLDVAIKAD